MIRAPMGHQNYWDECVSRYKKNIADFLENQKTPAINKAYEAQYIWNFMFYYSRHTLAQYSRGDAIRELSQPFAGLLDAWQLSNKLATEICAEHNLKTCRDWTFELSNLNHYNWCFWLVGLALSLEIPDDQWQRLLALIGGEGEDVLLDRVIASRQPTRQIGTTLLHKKPYARLLKAIEAKDKSMPQTQQAELLKAFVDHWYIELDRKGNNQLWWYIYGDPVKHPLEMGSYFGRWCIEAVAAVKAFGLDDSLCLGHEHYPGDLLRPDGATTHPLREEPKTNWLKRLFGK
jgi:hypothetical protein